MTNVPGYEHHNVDIRDAGAVNDLFKKHGGHISAVVHTASQPSHDWAARDPQTDFAVNANGTLNMLEAARNFCPEAPFIFYFDKQSLRRHAKSFAVARTGKALGDRTRP